MAGDHRAAIIAQSLYLANLLLLPGLSFMILIYYFFQHKDSWGLGRIHLYRSVQLTVVNGLMLLLLPIAFIFGANNQAAAIMLMLFYFVCVHAGFVLLGILNLSRAMSNRNPLF